MKPNKPTTLRDWREELYQAFHNMPSGVSERTEKFHEIANLIDSHFSSHNTELVSKIGEKRYKIVADLVRELERHPAQLRIKDALHQEYLSLRPDEIRSLFNHALDEVINLINQEK